MGTTAADRLNSCPELCHIHVAHSFAVSGLVTFEDGGRPGARDFEKVSVKVNTVTVRTEYEAVVVLDLIVGGHDTPVQDAHL